MITELIELHPTWAARFNDQDMDGMLALCEDGSAFSPQPGTVVSDAAAIRSSLEWFLSFRLPIRLNVRHTIEAGDIGLVVADWELTGTGPDGAPVALKGSAADVARRGPDGWRIVIDNPFGTA